MLFYFKYLDFILYGINYALKTSIPILEIALPLGISFFTFQQISFLIDTYKGDVRDIKFVEYASFISFFPQLIAGPIVRHNELIPQFNDIKNKIIDYKNICIGIYMFVLGLSKKVLLADVLGKAVDWGYDNISALNATSVVFVIVGYTFQIYFDFSGYSDMAMGVAYMFNIRLPHNFNSPYKACNVVEFWKRWHITLTSFLTDYIYIPMGGSKKGKLRKCINILTVFLISGIWHGAGIGFIAWGLVHGIFNIVTRGVTYFFKKYITRKSIIIMLVTRVSGWILTFCFINLSWVLFRTTKLSDAIMIYKSLIVGGIGEINRHILEQFEIPMTQVINLIARKEVLSPTKMMIFYIIVSFVILFMPNVKALTNKFKPNVLNMLYILLLSVACIVNLSGESIFLYFNF